MFQEAQQADLGFGWNTVDLVEENRATFGLLEQSDLAVKRAGEGAFFVTEQD